MAVNAISPKYSPLLMSASTWPLPTEQVQEVQVESEVVFDFTLSWEEKQSEFSRVGSTSVHALDYALQG
jgi:hypothetical protein